MKVFLGLSGGVDSAVAAYLLKQQGYQVTCGFMRNWDSLANDDLLGNPSLALEHCSQELDYQDALAVANQLELPLIRVDYIQEYWEDVFTTFLNQTKQGLTPNPDILCNRFIKFDAFYHHAMKLGFDAYATGHYAKIERAEGMNYLAKATDKLKDQSYFLGQVPFEALQKTIFPLQNLTKAEIRQIAEKLNLPIAKKKDSTGICFIGERQFRQFLTNYLSETEGNIVDIESQQVLAKHSGVMYYTIGQRHGLNISTSKGPYFVCGKDLQTNTLYVCKGQDNLWLQSDGCLVTRLNWFGVRKDQTCMAKFRYRQSDNPVSITFLDEDRLLVKIDPMVASVTCGQEAVFYQQDRVLGAGQIMTTYQNGKTLEERIDETISLCH